MLAVLTASSGEKSVLEGRTSTTIVETFRMDHADIQDELKPKYDYEAAFFPTSFSLEGRGYKLL